MLWSAHGSLKFTRLFITSATFGEVLFSPSFVCLFVCVCFTNRTIQKVMSGFHEIWEYVCHGQEKS